MKRLVLLICLLPGIHPTHGQTPAPAATPAPATVRIDLKNGTSVEVTSLRRAGTSVMVPLPNASGEIGYTPDKIAQIEFPEPPQINEAGDLLVAGKSDEALAKIEPIVAFHATLRDIPGNFWQPAAFLKLKALLALQRAPEAATLLDQIAVAAKGNPLIQDRVQVEKAASLTRSGQDEKALPLYDEVIQRSSDAETLAGAWLNKGRSLLALKQFDPAVLAFLHLPVFQSSQTLLLPAAMLGSAQAWRGLDDEENARSAYQELLDKFPTSPEAEIAKKEIAQLKKT